jgi:AmmeMemoRadiSam system protein B
MKDYSDLTPKLREDLVIKVIEEDSRKFLLFTDPKGFATEPVALPIEFIPFLQMLDGSMDINQLSKHLNEALGEAIDISPYLDLLQYLDYSNYTESPYYLSMVNNIISYLESPVRFPVCSGNSYPEDPLVLIKMLDDMINLANGIDFDSPADAILAPHIDFRIGSHALNCYALAYKAIAKTDADLFVIFGTAHHKSSDNFMLTRKDYSTPLGIAKTDTILIDKLETELNGEITIDDLAHMSEHSVEFQVLLLQYLFRGKDFKILPVVIGSFHPYLMNRTIPGEDEKFNKFIKTMNRVIRDMGKKPVFIASGDMAHWGLKFGDEFNAMDKIDELKNSDKILIEKLEKCDKDKFFSAVSDVGDKWKICGLSPVYSLMTAVNPVNAKCLAYEIWDESETSSAVSFASIAFYKEPDSTHSQGL